MSSRRRQGFGLLAAACAAAGLAVPGAAAGQVGVDHSFGNGGFVTTTPSVSYSADDEPHAAIEQPDGKLVVVGGSDRSYFLARYGEDGTLDATFGDHGVVLGPIIEIPGGVSEQGLAVALEPDGKIVVCGEASGGPQSFLSRYNADGTPDSGFGDGGRVENNDLFAAHALAIQADGKIVIAGATNDGLGLARYDSDGSPDASFGTGGEVTGVLSGYATGLAVLPGGKLVAGGSVNGGSFAARYNADGSADASFGSDGVATAPGDYLSSMAVAADGKVLLSSEEYDGTVRVTRLDADGQADTGFGTGGTATFEAGGAFPYGATQAPVAVRPDGSILVAVSTDHDIGLAHLSSDGTVDSSFGGNGIPTTTFDGTSTPFALVVRHDGRAVAVGVVGDQVQFSCHAGCTFPFTHEDLALAGFLADGSPDDLFGSGGAVRSNLRQVERTSVGSPNAVFAEPGGRLVVTGISASGSSGDFSLAGYTPDGSLDSSFGDDGLASTDPNRDYDYEMASQGVAARGPGGSIVEAGCAARFYSFTNICDAVVIARYGPDGVLDQSFGDGGVITTDRGNGQRVGAVSGVVVSPNGSVTVLAGFNTNRKFTRVQRVDLLRFNHDGSPDEAFGDHARVSLRRPAFRFENLTLLQAQSGRLVVAGAHGDCARVVGIQDDGALDASFGNEGVASRCFPSAFGSTGALFDLRRGILVYGGSGPGVAFARFLGDGSPDRSFGSRGRRITDVKALSDELPAALAPSGKIVFAGTRYSTAQNSWDRRRFTLLRFDPDGTPDRSFGEGGRLETGIRGRPKAIATTRGGAVVVAGARNFLRQPYERFTVARFRGGG